jgi:hypothetical protein
VVKARRRRIYEVMRYWDEDNPAWDAVEIHFARARSNHDDSPPAATLLHTVQCSRCEPNSFIASFMVI